MMLANDLKTYYDEVRRYLDCPKDEQDRLLLSVNKQVIELQVDNPNLDYIIDDGETFPEVEDTLVDTETLIKEIS